ESQHEDHDTAARHVIRALALAGRVAWPARRVRLLLQLAGEYLWRGRVALAEACYRRARRWAFWSDIPVEKASARAGLAACEGERGRFQRALRHHRAAFRLLKRAPVGSADEIWPELLHNAGWFHLYQGRTETAHSLFVEGRRFAEEHRNWVMAARCMISEAELLILLGGLPAATALAGRAAEIGVPADHAGLCRDAKEVLALACLCTGDLSTATSATTVAARRRGSVFGLGLAGIVAYRTGDRRSAHDLFEQARQRAEGPDRREERDFQAFDDHALVLCGLALCGEPEALPRAIALYRSARAMTSAPGPVLRAVRLLTQFGSDDDDGVLARARLAASGETTGGARRTRRPGS